MRRSSTSAPTGQGRLDHASSRPRWLGAPRRLLAAVVVAMLLTPQDAGAAAGPDRAPQEGSVLSAVLGSRQPAAVRAGDRRVTTVWGWPLTGRPDVVRGFDPPEQRWLAGHRGMDLAGVAGEPVLAVDDGVVAYSGAIAGVGVVSVDHASGLRSTYQPVTDRVARGERVRRGDRLGRLDAGGHCLVLDCLHLGARRGRDDYIDPTPLLQPVELSLLPVEPARAGP